MRRTALVGLAVAFTLGACASRADDGALGFRPTTTTRADGPAATTPSTSEPGSCTADDLDADALEPLLLDEREGFVLQADDVDDTGPSDLAKAIRDDEQADAATVLTDLGFRRGYQRYWANQAGSALVVFVYEFCDADSATAYGERVFDYVPGLEPFEVVGAPGSQGISGTTDGYVVAYATGTFGTTLVLTIASGPDGTVLLREARNRATALLIDQGAALTEP